MYPLEKLVRKNILSLYSNSLLNETFIDEVSAKIRLDTIENSLGSPLLKWYNRYPDQFQTALKQKVSWLKGVSLDHIFLSDGIDGCIDKIFRAFCEPRIDNVIICPPTYEKYQQSAHLNDVEIKMAPLLDDFQLNLSHIEQLINTNTKLIWICSPNSPSGNTIKRQDIETILNNFEGLVVVDEALINFSKQRSFIQEMNDYPNLVVMQTFSKAWGLAGLRLGMTFASKEIISILNQFNQTFYINQASSELIIESMNNLVQVNDMIKVLIDMRNALMEVLNNFSFIKKIYPTDANFLLIKVDDANMIYDYLSSRSIMVKNCTHMMFCDNCIRLTIGSEQENTQLIDALLEWQEIV